MIRYNPFESKINEGGFYNDEFPSYDDVRNRILRLRPIGDDESIYVEDTDGGQIIRSTRVISDSTAVSDINFKKEFIVTKSSNPAAFNVTEGSVVHGDTLTVVEEVTNSAFSPATSGYLVLQLQYIGSTYIASYGASTAFPEQGTFSEIWPIAYITYSGGVVVDIQQIHSSELRVTSRLV